MGIRLLLWVRVACFGGIVLGVTLGAASRVDAALIRVDTTDDEINADGDCSLREAVQAANEDTVVDACPAGSGDDIVEVPAGIFTVTAVRAVSAIIIRDDLVLRGAGPGTTVIQAAGSPGVAAARVVETLGGTSVTISGVTIRNGDSGSSGGGIHSSGQLTLTNAWVTDNQARTSGGGILNRGTLTLRDSTVRDNTVPSAPAPLGGGGVMNFGVLNLTHSTISGNSTSWGGGGILNSGRLTAVNSTISGNTAGGGGGGGLRNSDQATLTNVTITANDTTYIGGGIRALAPLDMHNTIVAANSAATAADDVDGPFLPVSNDAPAMFVMGTTPVTFAATDAAGNTGTAVAMVTVTER